MDEQHGASDLLHHRLDATSTMIALTGANVGHERGQGRYMRLRSVSERAESGIHPKP